MLILKIVILVLVLIHCSNARTTKKTKLTSIPLANNKLISSDVKSEGYNISILTWNLAEKSPSKKDCLFLKDYRNDDIVVLGIQECEDVRPRREEGHRSRAWKILQKAALGKNFTCLAQHKIGGIQTAIYVKKNIINNIQATQIIDVACGVGNVLTNKGAICILLRMRGRTLALVNAHLAAHIDKVREK